MPNKKTYKNNSHKKEKRSYTKTTGSSSPGIVHRILNLEASLFSRDYTNENIRKQISENSMLFFWYIGSLVLALFLIVMSFVTAYNDLRPDVSPYLVLSRAIEEHQLGLVFGITIIIVTGIWMHLTGTRKMFKHIRPSCSGRRYRAKEINGLVNDPDTLWIELVSVYAAPEALIGYNMGITVVEFSDIASVSLKSKHHSEKTSRHVSSGRSNFRRALYYALIDKYKEWDTYYVIIKTKKGRKMVLTEIQYKGELGSLRSVLEERCSGIEIHAGA